MENKSKLSKLYICIPLALFCCFLWGSAFPSIKVGYTLFNIGAEDSYSQLSAIYPVLYRSCAYKRGKIKHSYCC